MKIFELKSVYRKLASCVYSTLHRVEYIDQAETARAVAPEFPDLAHAISKATSMALILSDYIIILRRHIVIYSRVGTFEIKPGS